jgi:hypothetical protein
MALINDPNITAQIRDLANTGTIDTTQILSLLNSVLPAGQQITVGSAITTGIYKRFGDFDKINAKIEVVTTGIWTDYGQGGGDLQQFFTSSTQITSTDGQYYWNVFGVDPGSGIPSEDVQFAIAYGHKDGSGSVSLAIDENGLLPTKATYAQYRAMLLDNPSEPFSFETSTIGQFANANGIYVINIGRARYREEMDAGNWQLQLSGSNGLFRFIDDSGKKFGDTFGKAGRTFKVVSGSLELGSQGEAIVKSTTGSNGEGLGLFYPDRGIIVLNASAIGSVVGNVAFSTGSGHSETLTLAGGEGTAFNAYNQARLFSAIKNGGDFDARRTENVSTQHFFVRATNREFNYSNNPTYVDVNGNFTEPTFETDPRTFITTIGLYNDSNELVAVAKTSQPIAKSFDKEVLVKVKLSF